MLRRPADRYAKTSPSRSQAHRPRPHRPWRTARSSALQALRTPRPPGLTAPGSRQAGANPPHSPSQVPVSMLGTRSGGRGMMPNLFGRYGCVGPGPGRSGHRGATPEVVTGGHTSRAPARTCPRAPHEPVTARFRRLPDRMAKSQEESELVVVRGSTSEPVPADLHGRGPAPDRGPWCTAAVAALLRTGPPGSGPLATGRTSDRHRARDADRATRRLREQPAKRCAPQPVACRGPRTPPTGTAPAHQVGSRLGVLRQ